MLCPHCQFENEANNRFCVRCGEALPVTQAPNQVWNTDIDKEQNQKNSRSALIVLVAGLLALAVLVGALFVMLPTAELSLPNGFDSLFEGLFTRRPEPDRNGRTEYTEPMSVIEGTADEEYLTDFAALTVFNWDYVYDTVFSVRQERALLEQYADAEFADPALGEAAQQYIATLDYMIALLSDDTDDAYPIDSDAWELAQATLYSNILWMQEQYGIYPEESLYVPISCGAAAQDTAATYLAKGLLSASEPKWSAADNGYTMTVTNDSSYPVDVYVSIDFETDDEWQYEDVQLHIPANASKSATFETLPKDCTINNLYVEVWDVYWDNEQTIYDYYWDLYWNQFNP